MDIRKISPQNYSKLMLPIQKYLEKAGFSKRQSWEGYAMLSNYFASNLEERKLIRQFHSKILLKKISNGKRKTRVAQ